eukprot:TRINITY_DN16628_c0_g1_i1.p4 TRINITY_DN16628_c0_g1~~TRINITY_DN16628_c0_g1_i1.p4  ORF type:complete len:120 (-),score=22.19 TRINITY_DN16628_c0_g1_i1:801-1160(-)
MERFNVQQNVAPQQHRPKIEGPGRVEEGRHIPLTGGKIRMPSHWKGGVVCMMMLERAEERAGEEGEDESPPTGRGRKKVGGEGRGAPSQINTSRHKVRDVIEIAQKSFDTKLQPPFKMA